MKVYCVLSFAMLLGGCSSNHLVYVQEVSMGLNVSAGLGGTEKISLGYDRDVFAIVPKKDGVASDNPDQDAMSLVTMNKATIESLTKMRVTEFVAAGAPADVIADESDTLTSIREKVYEN
tara:strand:+ start:3808 stop:4167 length:360 start_codon:yes stop_codon:yes gene_type:complete